MGTRQADDGRAVDLHRRRHRIGRRRRCGGWNWYKDASRSARPRASARYEELIDAFTRNDKPARPDSCVDELNRDYAWTPYAALATLVAARISGRGE